MQNDTLDKLECQINIRITKEMRDELEAFAKERWTSASQIARLALAKELERMRETDAEEDSHAS